jgi:hypothetical protein
MRLILGAGEDNCVLIVEGSTCPVCCEVYMAADFMCTVVNVYGDVQVPGPEEVLSVCLRVVYLFVRLGKVFLEHEVEREPISVEDLGAQVIIEYIWEGRGYFDGILFYFEGRK